MNFSAPVVTEPEIETQTKVLNIFSRPNSGGQLESKGRQVEQKRKAQMPLSSHFSGGFLG